MWLFKIRRLAREIGREALVLLFAIRDPATPVALKAASVAALAYLFSPLDLLPDVPVIGWVDDLLLISVGVPFLIRRLPPAVYLRASAKAARLLASLGVEAPPERARQAGTAKQAKPNARSTRSRAGAKTAEPVRRKAAGRARTQAGKAGPGSARAGKAQAGKASPAVTDATDRVAASRRRRNDA